MVRSTPRRCRPATEQTVLGDFNGVNFTYAGVTSTFFRRDGKFMVRTDGPEGVLDRSGGSSNKLTYGTESSACVARSVSATVATGSCRTISTSAWAITRTGSGRDGPGVGYRFDRGDVVLVYRNLSYSTTGDAVLQDMRMAGPALGATFRW